MDVSHMSFEHMQTVYQSIKHTWPGQDDATKRQMAEQLRAIYRSLAPGERGFMTDIHHLEREIDRHLDTQTATTTHNTPDTHQNGHDGLGGPQMHADGSAGHTARVPERRR